MTAERSRYWRKRGRRAAIAAGVFIIVISSVLLKIRHDYDALPPASPISDLSLSTVVLDRNGRLLRAFTSRDEKWRLPVELDDIDPLYFKMLLAFEDKRFHEHSGVDIKALIRSVLQSLRHGRIVSGGSTLTMQAVRLLDEKPTKSFGRKYEQFLKAIQLERAFSKEEILRIYTLRAPFGGNLEGIRAASLIWFGKEPGRLTAAEAALLVALPQSPEMRRPDRFPKHAREARNRVLRRGASVGIISENEALSASSEPVRTQRNAMPFFAAHESRNVRQKSPEKTVHHLMLDRDLQSALEKMAKRKIGAYPAPVSMAVVVADHRTGEVLASVGSPDLLDGGRSGHVDMTRSNRSPGSTLKPFIYGLAFEEGIGAPGSYIVDRPADIGGYQPTNFDRSYQGTVTLREALQLSLNTPAVQLLEAVGPSRLLARLKRAGVRPVIQGGKAPGLAIGLGGLGLSLRDLTGVYAALARGGEPVLLKSCKRNCAVDHETRLPSRLLSAKAAWFVGDILSELPQARAGAGTPIAYKTGTSYGYRDAWAIGFDGRYVASVWVGRPDGSPVPGQTGATAAVPLLFEVFQKFGPDRIPLRDAPDGMLSAKDADVPLALKYARVANSRTGRTGSSDFRIEFPPDGAELDLGFANKDEPRSTQTPLVVKAEGGRRPYSFLVNGVPQTTDDFSSKLIWHPERAGFVNVTALDAQGRSARISVQLR